jgi:hypothetical protein
LEKIFSTVINIINININFGAGRLLAGLRLANSCTCDSDTRVYGSAVA